MLGTPRFHGQRDAVDREAFTLLNQAHAGLRVDRIGGEAGLVAGE
jgi:hypothetical protein